jgi:hypothetical protein
MDRLLNKIVDNVQVIIRDIHVRYENDIAAIPYSMGFTLSELTI